MRRNAILRRQRHWAFRIRLECFPVWRILVFAVSLFVLLIADSRSSAFDAASELDLESAIDQSIADLDDASFTVREQAVERLKGFGFAAIQPLSRAAEDGSLEVSVRAVDVLETIYKTSGDWIDIVEQESHPEPELPDAVKPTQPADAEPVTEPAEIPFAAALREFGREPRPVTETTDAAEVALEQLTRSANRSVASRAAAALGRNYQIREKRALAEILRLGGSKDYFPQDRPRARLPNASALDHYFIVLDESWNGGAEGLQQVKRLTRLNNLYVIDGAPISSESLEDLQGALPNLQIHFRGEANLGISSIPGQIGGLGCHVQRVSKGKAADRAGIRSGDVIVGFGGKQMTNFGMLIETIRTYKAGDKVTVQLQRGGRIQEVDVELDRWAPSAPPPAPKKKGQP